MTPKQYRRVKAAIEKMQENIAKVKKQISILENKKPKKHKKYSFSVPFLYRDDGERFSRNSDGTYSMDKCDMPHPYKYTYARLMDSGAFSVYRAKLDKRLQRISLRNIKGGKQ